MLFQFDFLSIILWRIKLSNTGYLSVKTPLLRAQVSLLAIYFVSEMTYNVSEWDVKPYYTIPIGYKRRPMLSTILCTSVGIKCNAPNSKTTSQAS